MEMLSRSVRDPCREAPAWWPCSVRPAGGAALPGGSRSEWLMPKAVFSAVPHLLEGAGSHPSLKRKPWGGK